GDKAEHAERYRVRDAEPGDDERGQRGDRQQRHDGPDGVECRRAPGLGHRPPSNAPDSPGPVVAAPHRCLPEGTAPHRTEVRLGSPGARPYRPIDDECRRRHRREVSTARDHNGPPPERHHWMGSMALNELGKMLTAAEVAEM